MNEPMDEIKFPLLGLGQFGLGSQAPSLANVTPAGQFRIHPRHPWELNVPSPSLPRLQSEGLEFYDPVAITNAQLLAASRELVDLQRREQWSKAILLDLQAGIRNLTAELAFLRDQILRLKRQVFVVPLTTLASEGLELIGEIPVLIEGNGEEFTATFAEANVSSSGETESDAMASLKDTLISRYEILEGTPVDKLGPLPRRQWDILRQVIRRTTNVA